jgi:hypothetical protein
VTDAAANSVATRGLDPRAIALGAAAILAIGLSSSYVMQQLFLGSPDTANVRLFQLLSTAIGLVSHAVGGATAGLVARRRGAVHGGIACLLASLGGVVVTLVMVGRQGQLSAILNIAFVAQWLIWVLLGMAIGVAAGAIAARVAAAAKP